MATFNKEIPNNKQNDGANDSSAHSPGRKKMNLKEQFSDETGGKKPPAKRFRDESDGRIRHYSSQRVPTAKNYLWRESW